MKGGRGLGFHFKLEKVRSYKKFVEKKFKLQLGEAYDRQRKVEKSLQAYRSARDNSPAVEGAVKVNELLQEAAYTEALDKQIAHQQEQLQQVAQEVDKKKDRVQAAMKERKVFDRLREHRLSAYRYKRAIQEQNQLDEVAGNSFHRNRIQM